MKTSLLVSSALILGLSLATSLASQVPSYTQFGRGCAGSAGTPVLAAAPGSLPFLGQTFEAQVTNIPLLTVGIGITGLSKTSWGRTALPFDLIAIGMPGCLLYTDFRRTAPLVITRGVGTWNTAIPKDPAFIGVSFYQQAFILDSSVPGLGAVMSNAAEGVIGVVPDLVISSGMPTVTPPTIPPGARVSISSVTVRNIGTGAAGASTTGYYLSTDATITSADQLLLDLPTSGIAPGGFRSFGAVDITIPLPTRPGNYWIGLLADSARVVAELNENNNFASTALTVTTSLPDLTISSRTPSVTPAIIDAGRTVTLSAVDVQNRGATAAGAFSIGYYLSTDATISSADRLLTSVHSRGLAVGAIVTLPSRVLTIPLTTAPGNYYIGVLVDSTDQVVELNEGNNTIATGMTVTPALPELFPVSMPTVSPNPMARPSPGAPAPFTLGSFTVENSGLVSSGLFRVGIYFYENGTFTPPTHTLIGNVIVGDLGPGQTVTIDSLDLLTLRGLSGTYAIVVFVDHLDEVVESDESNNELFRVIRIVN